MEKENVIKVELTREESQFLCEVCNDYIEKSQGNDFSNVILMNSIAYKFAAAERVADQEDVAGEAQQEPTNQVTITKNRYDQLAEEILMEDHENSKNSNLDGLGALLFTMSIGMGLTLMKKKLFNESEVN